MSPLALRQRRVVITGAAGFIGHALTSRLLAEGAEVVGIDVKPTATAERYRHIVGDASDMTPSLLDELAPDFVFHLASIVGVVEASADPEATRQAILGMTRQFVDLVADRPGTRFIYVSSSEVYGQALSFPITETSALAPLSPYGRAKRDAETVVLDAVRGGLDAVIVRPFNVYGPGQRHDFVTSRFIALAREAEPLTVVDGGQQVRTFTYIDDFIEGLVRVATLGGDERVFNVAGSETTSIAELAAAVIDASGSMSTIRPVDGQTLGRPRSMEVRDRVASIDLAMGSVGYRPTVGVREGIRRMLAAANASRDVPLPSS